MTWENLILRCSPPWRRGFDEGLGEWVEIGAGNQYDGRQAYVWRRVPCPLQGWGLWQWWERLRSGNLSTDSLTGCG